MRVERWRPTRCRDCGRRENARLKISARGLCTRCAANRIGDSHEQMRTLDGPIGERWYENTVRGMRLKAQRSQAS